MWHVRKSHEQGWRWWPWGEDEDEDEGENEDEDDDDDDDDGDGDDGDDDDDDDDDDDGDHDDDDGDDDDDGVVMWWCGLKFKLSKRKQQVRSEGQSWKFRVSSFQSRHRAVFAHPQPQNWRTPCAGKWCLDQSGV